MSADPSVFHLIVLIAAGLLLITAAVSDANRYRIPNIVCLSLLALFPLFVLTAPHEIEWDQHLMVFALVLGAGFIMFARNLAGAGDIKLLAVTGLWAGPHLLALFLFITAIAGGLLALIVAGLTHRRNLVRGAKNAVALAKVPIPYGVAIAVGGLCTLVMLSHPVLFFA
jgi:prepilin peptidase CpaA